MKDGSIFKLIITKTRHQLTQYQNIIDTFPILCTDKNYQGIDNVTWTRTNLVETNFIPPYLNANQRFVTNHVEIVTVNLNNQPDPNTGLRPPIITMVQQRHVFNANLQKELLSEFEQNFKIKSQEYSKFLADKEALITIIFGQCDKATKTKISLGTNYAADRQAGKLIAFLNQLRTICFSSDNAGLSYAPYKQGVAVKLLNNYSNNKPHDPHSFKEEVKIKYNITGKFPNVTAVMMALLAAAAPAID